MFCRGTDKKAYHIQSIHRDNQYDMGRSSDTLPVRNHIRWDIGSPSTGHTYPDKLEQLSNTRVRTGDLAHYPYEINNFYFGAYILAYYSRTWVRIYGQS